MTLRVAYVLCHPVHYIGAQPADSAAVKTLFSRKLAKHGHAEQPPSWPTRKPRDVVSAQELLPGRESLIHILGKRNVPGIGGRRRTLIR
jgi:hypothetical protein